MSLKVIQAEIKDFNGITFKAMPNGANILLVGKNGRGKSTFLQAIQMAFGDSSDIPKNPTGQAIVIAEKDGQKITYELKFDSKGKPKIKVNGLRDVTKSYLTSLTGAVGFDPLEFVRWSKDAAGQKKQVAQFKRTMPEDVLKDVEGYERSIASNFAERTETNKEVAELEGFINSHPLKNSDLAKFVYVDLKDVLQQQKTATEKNQQIEKIKANFQTRLNEIEKGENEIKDLLAKIDSIKKSNDLKETENEKDSEWLALPENQVKDLKEYSDKISSVSEDNKKFEQAKLLKEKTDLFKSTSQHSLDLTQKIKLEREAVADLIKSFEGGIPGLAYENDVLTYNGVPVDEKNLSTSEIMELGIRMKIAENPDYPLFLENTNLMDEDRWNDVLKLAKENDIQIIGEEVRRGQDELIVEFIPG